MFGRNKADKLVDTLEAYRREFDKRIRPPESREARVAKALLDEAKRIVDQGRLGIALAPTLIEHTYHWPSLSKRSDFPKFVSFPATNIAASEVKAENEIIKGILFTYHGQRYGVRFVDKGWSIGPNSETIHSGTVDLVVEGDAVLGLNIMQDKEERARWRWFDLYAFKAGAWARHLLEIAIYIEYRSQQPLNELREEELIERTKNIKL